MINAHNQHRELGLKRLIALVTEALTLSDELGFVYVAIDLSEATDKLIAMHSAEPDDISPV